MKWFLFSILIAASVCMQAQNQLPKLRYHAGFFSDRYELGDKDVKPPDIRAHLQKNNNDAYYLWRRSESLEKQSIIFTCLGAVGLVVALVAKNDSAVIGGYGAVAVCSGASLISILAAGAKREKAIDTYNRAAGY